MTSAFRGLLTRGAYFISVLHVRDIEPRRPRRDRVHVSRVENYYPLRTTSGARSDLADDAGIILIAPDDRRADWKQRRSRISLGRYSAGNILEEAARWRKYVALKRTLTETLHRLHYLFHSPAYVVKYLNPKNRSCCKCRQDVKFFSESMDHRFSPNYNHVPNNDSRSTSSTVNDREDNSLIRKLNNQSDFMI